ncbi:MAG: hypothetical protein M3198_14500 [Actinomycetota bacterium]|nr:hypothetical protein [Actinomycetota bacterium]
MEHFKKLRQEVEALPGTRLQLRVKGPREDYWYDPNWYRTMYSLAAVYVHILSTEANREDNGFKPPAESEPLRYDGERVAMELVGACWLTISDLSNYYGRPPGPHPMRPAARRVRYRQRLELAAFLHNMLPSAILVLVNLRLLKVDTPYAGVLPMGGPLPATRDDRVHLVEWRRRAAVLDRLDPRLRGARASPSIEQLLSVIDPVEFLPARARYNVACVHAETAQYQDQGSDAASENRKAAIAELANSLGGEGAEWAREDPALWMVRTHAATRADFARLLARALPNRRDWGILQTLPFLQVIDAARLWVASVRNVEALLALSDTDRAAICEEDGAHSRLREAQSDRAG